MLSWIFKKLSVQGDRVNLNKNLHSSFSNIKKDMEEAGKWIKHFKEKHDENEQKHAHHERKIADLSRRIDHVEETLENLNVQSFMNVQSLEKLTPAQKNIIALLVYAGGPLSYEDISKKLGLSIVTVRRHMNDIKRVGFKLEEKNNVRDRRKLFFFGEKEKRSILKATK